MLKVSFCDHKMSIFRPAGLYQQLSLHRIALNFIGWSPRALTPIFGNRTGALEIGKISCILTKIGKFYIVFKMYEVCIARLIQKLSLLFLVS